MNEKLNQAVPRGECRQDVVEMIQGSTQEVCL